MKSPTGRNKKALLQFHLQHSLSRFEMMVDHIQTLIACSLAQRGALAFIKGPATGVDEAARTEGVGTATETEMAATAGERL